MRTVVALLRAVNVGGTGKLAMRDLVSACEATGFVDVRTYIQSGNVVFRTRLTVAAAGDQLAQVLHAEHGLRGGVVAREAADLRAVLAHNPFPEMPPSKVAVLFSSGVLPPAQFIGLEGPAGERVVPRSREVYISYPAGMGRSKLKLPKTEGVSTMRNMNTVARLVAMCDGLPADTGGGQ